MTRKHTGEAALMSIFRFGTLAAALAVTILVGQVTDKTTGQPLIGVQITGSAHSAHFLAKTNRHGMFHLNLPPGRYTLHLSSADVPPQQREVLVKGKRQSVTLEACSTTLDYSCGQGGPGGA